MKRGLLSLGLLGLLVSGFARIEADETEDVPAVLTSPSQTYPAVTCSSTDPIACADTLQLAVDAREQLGPLLKLGPNWRFPVHIHIVTPDDPLAAKIHREASAIFANDYNKSMKIEAALPSTDPDAREFIQRQFVMAMLWEKFFATTQTFDASTKLDVVPVWLLEGLRESLNEDPAHDRESIVRKTVQSQRAPTLEEITAWQQVSDDRLLGLWQRAFCFYLVDSLTQPGPRRDNFQQWLSSLSGSNPTSAKFLFPTETGWQRELVDATQRSRDLVYTWDETAAELAAKETIAIASDKAANTKICTLDTVATFPRDKKLIDAVQQKILDLTSLELRAHPSWHEILETYRFALSALITEPTPETAKKSIQRAHALRVTEMADHQKLVDYINWFEVTKDCEGDTTHFRSYFSTAEEMERVQADPAHPNPIRANLLQVESQL